MWFFSCLFSATVAFVELLWAPMAGQSHLWNTISKPKRLLQVLNKNCILNLLREINVSAVAVHCTTFMLIFGCVVGVNPAPTTLSRSSLPCIAPWQFYCTSFLGHDPLHSGCFPSVFVAESEGPSLLQGFIPISDRYRGEDTEEGEGSERICTANTPQSKCVDNTLQWLDHRAHSEDTNVLRAWSTCI